MQTPDAALLLILLQESSNVLYRLVLRAECIVTSLVTESVVLNAKELLCCMPLSSVGCVDMRTTAGFHGNSACELGEGPWLPSEHKMVGRVTVFETESDPEEENNCPSAP